MADPSAPKPVRKPRLILRLHRWVSLTFAAFWLIQAVTGMLVVFHWEAEDATVAGAHRPTDLAAIDARIAALAPPGSGKRIVSLWVTAGFADRYEITVADAEDVQHAVRISGDGAVLRTKLKSERGLMGTLVSVHQRLLAGDTGEWIVGISGILLLSNLAMGLTLAWPRRGQWRRTMTPSNKGPLVARFFSWHRALGLWVVLVAFCTVSAGTMLRFEDGVSDLVGAHGPVEPPAIAAAVDPIPFSRAVRAATEALPGSRFTAAVFPTDKNLTYRLRVLAPGEIRRAYGTSVVFVNGIDGTVRLVAPAAERSGGKAFVDGLYAVHTGEIGGLAGRLLILTIGLWLATMVVTGVLLWQRRRPR